MKWEDIVKNKDWERMSKIVGAKNILKDIKKIIMELQYGVSEPPPITSPTSDDMHAIYEDAETRQQYKHERALFQGHQKMKDDLDRAIEILEEY